MRAQRLVPIALAILLIAAIASAQRVERVIDGDTIVVQGVGTVRLIGVDTPEAVDPRRPVQDFGTEASAFTRRLATGKVARLEFERDRRDRYGRTLAYVYLPDGVFLNAEIVRQGYGLAYTEFSFRYLEEFRGYEREARDTGRGLWGAPEATAHLPAIMPLSQTGCVNINTANATELERIIHIGPERAQQILALRRQRFFRSANDLTRVDGIGAGRLRDILAQKIACVP